MAGSVWHSAAWGRRVGRLAAVGLLAAACLGARAGRAHAQIVVDNRPLQAAEIVAWAPFRAQSGGTAQAPAGRVGFAQPVVASARAKGLGKPAHIPADLRVVWIEFAFRVQGVAAARAASLTFQVRAPPRCTALNLVPFLVTEGSLAGRGHAGVPVGRVLSREVVFRSLAPTILGDGLQENVYSWMLTGPAIAWAPKRFAAVMAVPAERTALPLKLAVTLRLKSAGSGNRQWVATAPQALIVPLQAEKTVPLKPGSTH